ncbi:MAG: DUF2786 domain-containing protein, partial [Actinomycetota bacterium]|nr:DUF2786 domain-containing protein [Actinomycetota bacterium]
MTAVSPWRTHAHLDPDWARQLDDLDAEIGAPGGARPAMAEWVAQERLDVGDALWRAAQLLAQLWRTPGIAPVGDPPSQWGRSSRRVTVPGATPAGIDERILTRVRALLAKAESTEFEPEAEALTEKAQELMARYAIDAALLSGTATAGAAGEQPVSRGVLIHDPYAKGKATLLSNVGRANRCQTVWSKDFGHCTGFGFPTDLAVTDILFTSLVAQSSRAMLTASKGVRNPRSFRESFGVSFALHIGDRLRETTDKTVAEATADHGDLLPVLASRDEAVESARQAAFPKLRSTSV